MKNVLDSIQRQCKKSENALNKLYKEMLKEVSEYNDKHNSHFFCDGDYETSDSQGTEKKIERDGQCVWVSNTYVNTNAIPEGAETFKSHYYISKKVAYWYTPYTYNDNKYSLEEFYKKAETEKVLYEGSEIKVSMVRRHVIPNAHSYQWCPKISHHEYVMYYQVYSPTPRLQKQIKELDEEIRNRREEIKNLSYEDRLAIMRPLLDQLKKLSAKKYKWIEVANEKTLSKLFVVAKRYFNDWYKY